MWCICIRVCGGGCMCVSVCMSVYVYGCMHCVGISVCACVYVCMYLWAYAFA